MRTQQHASDFYVGAALVAARPLRLTAAFSRTSRRPAGGCGPPPLHPGVGAPRFRGPRANPAKRFAWGKGGPAAGVSVRACPEANDPKLGPTLSRCCGCATPHCLPLREKHLAPAAQLLFRLRDSLCGCDPRLRASCHAARPPRRASFIRGSPSRHSRCGLRYKRATGTFAHAAVSPPCPLSSPMRLPYALLFILPAFSPSGQPWRRPCA